MIGQTVKHYEIIAKIGAGGMGEVYLASDTKLGRKVALKFLPREFTTDPERRRRLELEASSASSLDHPNILTIFEINDHEDQPFIAMAYVDGETLKERMLRERLPLDRAIRYGIQLASALGGAHAHGIIHRDVKPDNVLIGKDDRVRLADFGLAKMKESAGLTGRGATVGTVGYMSPEQAQGMTVDARSDVFSLGVILYEMVSGRLPFAAEHAAAALYSIVHEQPPSLADVTPPVPDALIATIERALSKKPEQRQPDGATVETDLRAVARSMEISHISSGQVPVASIRRRKRSRVLWAAAGIAAMILGVIFASSGPDSKSPGPEDARAAENTLAVMKFENLSDPTDAERQGDIIAELLTTDLSASEFVKVVSSQHLFDLVKQETGDENGKIDRGEAVQIARRAGANRMLTGALSKLSGRSIITAQIVDVSSGEVLGSERVDGEDLFGMVDSLSVRIKRRIGLTETQVLAGDIPVSEATTSSPAAYRAYTQGMEYYHALNWDQAHSYFDRAIELDSGFALAYLRKGVAYFSDQRATEGYRTFAIARRLMHGLPPCDSLLLHAMAVDLGERQDFEGALRTFKRSTVECPTHKEAFFWVANFSRGNFRHEPETTVVYSQRALDLDPDYPYALLALGGGYLELKKYDDAKRVVMHHHSVRPRDVYPLEALGDIYLAQGNFDSARTWYREAIKVAPDQRNGYREIARIFVLQGQPDSGITWYSKTLASDNMLTRQLALRSVASIHKSWGRFEESAGYYRKAAAMAEAAHFTDQQAGAHNSLAWLYLDTDRPEAAMKEFERISVLDTISPQGEVGQSIALCMMGRFDEARRLSNEINREWAGRIDTMGILAGEYTLEGCIGLESQDYQKAYDNLLKARHYNNDTTSWRIGIAEALIGLGQYDKALAEARAYRKDAELSWPSADYLHGLYLEADALVKLSRTEDAVEPLQRLMVFWGAPDWEVPWLTDAKKLYASLTAQ